ncbi:MAG: squalene synthase HpnD [Acetobacteraceae bacterium]|nr:squalene synthase HpnD [Acetobacteraceae bacterium]MSP29364.1 squalene synthase HpnD [Acetobacteraceae bacterium]
MQTDLAEIEDTVKAAGTSFYQGMRVLAPDRRYAMYAIYAFCRIIDDIVDEEGSLEGKLACLAEWRGWVGGLYRGEAHDAVTRLLLHAVQAFDIRKRDFLDVIDGVQMDSGDPIVAPDLATLDLYCDRVASAVGRLSVRAFGDASASADLVALHLGRALQLTNILRDVADDAAIGRLYLPREYLLEAGVPLRLPEALAAPGMAVVCARVAVMARRHFTLSRLAMDTCNHRAMKPARLMAATYGTVLSVMERRGWEKFDQRVSVPKWRKILLALRCWLL